MLCNIIQNILDDVPEKGSLEILLYFQDEEQNNIIPADLWYTLTDVNGNIINNLDQVSLPLASEVSFFLNDEDLSLDTIEKSTGWAYRYIWIGGKYNSGAYSDLSISAAARFKICAVKARF